ncbi:MAG: 1,4-beta-xylanase, partial [Flavobacterium sp.]
MRKIKLYLTLTLAGLLLLSCNKTKSNSEENKNETATVEKREIWTKEQANKWYAEQPWLVGANYYPSTAINQLEMWQADTFDAKRIDQELGWAEGIGMNVMRVYLHDLLHKQDAEGLYKRMDTFLGIADKHHIKILFVLFDSCWDPFP